MKEFFCGAVVPGCKAVFRGETDEDILHQVAGHADSEHGIKEVPHSLVDKVKEHIHAVA